MTRFKDRMHAGKLLARELDAYAHHPDAIVLALPRGGVPVGFALAHALGLALDVLLVRKLGMPGHEEYAIGAVASGGVRVLQQEAIELSGVQPELIATLVAREQAVIEGRERLYRGARPPPALAGRTVILADDGLATGASMRAAVAVARAQSAARIVIAVPVGAPDSVEALAAEVDQIACLSTPMLFRAVSQWYRNFDQTSDAEVQDLLAIAWREQARLPAATHP
jgi:predicted phosphoribosyltransferase